MNPKKLSPELAEFQIKVEPIAKKLGLDPFETVFYMVDYNDMNQLMSYDGFPKRFHHWTHGMKSIYQENQYRYGLAKAFELVLNTDYCNAFLLNNNSFNENKFVICHVYGHNDFFKNNMWFSKTNRNMIMEMDRNAEIIQKFSERHGEEKVEKFLEIALSVDGLIDPYRDFMVSNQESLEERLREAEAPLEKPKLIKTGDSFIDKLLNTPKHLKSERMKILIERKKKKKFPRELQKDILTFLIDNARMNNPNFAPWQQEILKIIREESYYFVPQKLTKIMNEGWASYWHVKLMAEMRLANDDGIFDFSKLHSSVATIRPGQQVNPYALGLNLYRWIEHKWDTGKHGLKYEECNNLDQKLYWDTKDMKSMEKLFHVRRHYNDILFISEFLDQEFCDEHKLWKYGSDGQGNIIVISKDVRDIKDEMIQGLYNCGEPLIYVKDANYKNRGQLLLHHDFEFNKTMLDLSKSVPVLKNIRNIWGRDVCLDTHLYVQSKDGKTAIAMPSTIRCTEKAFVFLTYDGNNKVIKKEEVSIDEFN